MLPKAAAAPEEDMAGCTNLGEGEDSSLVQCSEGCLECGYEFLLFCGTELPESLTGLRELLTVQEDRSHT